jgi:hypothetical protein
MDTEKKKTAGYIAATALLTLGAVSGAFWLGSSQIPKDSNNANIIVQSTEKDLRIKGNRDSMIYHLPNCPNYNDISPSNVVWFKTHDEAKAAGFRMARNC